MASQYRTSDEAEVGGLPRQIDVDALAAAQGVGPIKDFRDLKAEFWPENESVDEFVKGIREQRTKDVVNLFVGFDDQSLPPLLAYSGKDNGGSRYRYGCRLIRVSARCPVHG